MNNLKVLVIALGCYFLTLLIPDLGNLYVNVAVPSIAFMLLYTLLILKLNISKDISEVFSNLLKRFSGFKL
jgi:hypothetical protein